MPRAYIPIEIERRVCSSAQNRCGYCLSPQHLVMARLEIDHIIPLSAGGSDDETNLWLSCPICNRHKSNKISKCRNEEYLWKVWLMADTVGNWPWGTPKAF